MYKITHKRVEKINPQPVVSLFKPPTICIRHFKMIVSVLVLLDNGIYQQQKKLTKLLENE